MSEASSTPKVKRIRMTAWAKQTLRQAYKEKQGSYSTAFKHGTTVYAREKEKDKKGGMSAERVSELINNQFNEVITAQTIQQNVKDGKIGSSLLQRGPKGSMPELHYKNLLLAFKSFVVISNNNGMARECCHKKLALREHQVLHTTPSEGRNSRDFLKRVL